MTQAMAVRTRIGIEIDPDDVEASAMVLGAAFAMITPTDPVDVVLCLTGVDDPTQQHADVVRDLCLAVAGPCAMPDIELCGEAEAHGLDLDARVPAGARPEDTLRSVELTFSALRSPVPADGPAPWRRAMAVPDADERVAAVGLPRRRAAAARGSRGDALVRILERDAARRPSLPADRPVHVAVVAGLPATWGSVETVCEALEKRDDARLSVIAVDARTAVPGSTRALVERHGYVPRDLAWFTANADDIDVVVLDNPWETHRVVPLRTGALAARGIRLVYIPYGNNVLEGAQAKHMLYDGGLHHMAWRAYLRSETQRAMYARYGSVDAAHVRVEGYPKLDRVSRPSATQATEDLKRRLAGRTTFLWNPHYTVNSQPGMSWSTFDVHLEALLDHFLARDDRALLLRPHPNLFRKLRDMGGAATSIEPLLRRLARERDNIVIDDDADYLPAFSVADAMVSDVSSLVTEFLPTGKPLLLLVNPRGPGWNEDSSYFADVPHATEWAQLRDFIDCTVRGEDPHRDRRRSSLARHFTQCDGLAGERIAAQLVTDFRCETESGSARQP
jgi:hypothetical protein